MEELPDFADDGSLAIGQALVRGEWAQMRFMTAVAASSESADWNNETLFALLVSDPVQRDLRFQRADTFADLVEDKETVLPRHFLLSLLLLSDAADYVATTLLSRIDVLDDAQVGRLLGHTSDPALKSAALCKLLLEGLDRESEDSNGNTALLDEQLSEPDPSGTVGSALLAARPATVAGCDFQWNLVVNRIERTRWVPERESLIHMADALLRTAPPESDEWAQLSDQARLAAFFRGGARTQSERNMGRSAAVLSLFHLRYSPDLESLGCGIFESARVSAWQVLDEILRVAQWPDGAISPADGDLFHSSIAPALLDLAGRGENQSLQRLLDLGTACFEAIDGAPEEYSVKFMSTAARLAQGDGGIHHGAHEALDAQFAAMAIWGVSDPKDLESYLIPDAPHIAIDDVAILPGHSVMEFAQISSLHRRHGPAALLLLVDLAIQAGDLRQARMMLAMAEDSYPRSSMIFEWQMKLDLHAGNARRAERRRIELQELWRAGDDEASPLAQVGVIERLAKLSACATLAHEHALRVREQPVFSTWIHRLNAVLGG